MYDPFASFILLALVVISVRTLYRHYLHLLTCWPGAPRQPNLFVLGAITMGIYTVIVTLQGLVDLLLPATMPFTHLPANAAIAVTGLFASRGIKVDSSTYLANFAFIGWLKMFIEVLLALTLAMWFRHRRYLATSRPDNPRPDNPANRTRKPPP